MGIGLIILWVGGVGPEANGPGGTSPHGRGWVQGQVLWDGDLSPELIMAEASWNHSGSRGTSGSFVQADGSFLVQSVSVGEVDLGFSLGQGGDLLGRLHRVHLPGAGQGVFIQADLRDTAHCFILTVLGHDGSPAEDVMVFWRTTRAEGAAGKYAHWMRTDSPCQLVSASDLIDVAFVAPGSQVLEVPAVSLSRSFQLREGNPVRIALPEGIHPRADGVELAVRLEAVEPDPRFKEATLGADGRGPELLQDMGERVFDGETVEFVVPAPGEYGVRWRVYRTLSEDALEILNLGADPTVIQVTPRSYATVFRPAFPMDRYREQVGKGQDR